MIPAILAALGEASAAGGTAGAAEGAGGAIAGASSSVGQLTNVFGKMDLSAKRLQSTLTAFPAKILEVEHLIVSTGQSWVRALAAPIDTVKALGGAISEFVKLANPASVYMFNYRLENASATLGRILNPVLEALTRAAERTGDAFAKIKPALDPAIDMVSDLVDMLSSELTPALRELAPLIQLQTTLWRSLGSVITATGIPIVRFMEALRRVGIVNPLAGLFPNAFDERGKSDVAIQQARFGGTEELQREMAKNALMASATTPGEVGQKDVPNLVKQIYDWLTEKAADSLAFALARVIVDNLAALSPASNLPALPGFVSRAEGAGLAQLDGLMKAIFGIGRQES